MEPGIEATACACELLYVYVYVCPSVFSQYNLCALISLNMGLLCIFFN